jgi:hypothetical protein
LSTQPLFRFRRIKNASLDSARPLDARGSQRDCFQSRISNEPAGKKSTWFNVQAITDIEHIVKRQPRITVAPTPDRRFVLVQYAGEFCLISFEAVVEDGLGHFSYCVSEKNFLVINMPSKQLRDVIGHPDLPALDVGAQSSLPTCLNS